MYSKFFKRIIDIFASVIALPIFIVFYIIFGLLIKLEDRGPVFYKAERIGKNSRIFKMYKFRSMKVDAPTLFNIDGSTYNSEDDPRVTKIGKFMRESSIDEIPQIINVLKGDMSLIGPRASLSSVLDTYKDDEIDKMKVRPGITGYTQAYFRNGLSNREKRLKDAWYANNLSLLLDFKIVCKTILTVFSKEGLYTNTGENTSRNNPTKK
ncbi:sugar transferase [Oceanobacillus luteolus]|uniref:sugar transferase n=1 Tax=Oceanobacillus luteolus TaxID=1274358 RepID=UPI00203AF14A|nr:sugar transferase [Oceanobacillus luteolus]MCM3741807.1 sugar transferase [Oceanobacillus luteolus]